MKQYRTSIVYSFVDNGWYAETWDRNSGSTIHTTDVFLTRREASAAVPLSLAWQLENETMNELQTVKAKREFYEQGGINRLAGRIFDNSAAISEPSVDCELRYHDGEWFFLVGLPGYDFDHRGFWGASCFGRHYSKQKSRDVAHYLLGEVMDAIAASTK